MDIEASELSVIISFSISLILGFFFYFKDKYISETASPIKYIIIASRFFCLFSILFLLFGPLLISKKINNIEPKILLLFDDSESMKISDANLKDQILPFVSDLESDLKSKVSFIKYKFSDSMLEFDSLNYSGSITDIQKALYSISEIHQNENISSVVLISDGIINSGGVELINPLNVPVYSIGVGDTLEVKDAVIQSLYFNDVTYTGNDFPIELSGVIHNMKNEKQRLQIKYDGKLILDSLILPTSQKHYLKLTHFINAEEPGIKPIEVKLVNDVVEKSKENNQLKRFVKVLDSRQKIAFVFNSPHPDVRALKSVFKEDENYQIHDFKLSKECPDLNTFNTVILIGGGERKDINRWRDKLEDLKVNSLWLTGVNSEFKTTDFTLTKLDNSKDESKIAVKEGFSLFKLDPTLIEFLNEAPPLSVPFGKWRIKNINQNLATQKINGVETNYPLISFSDNGSVRKAFILGEGIWRWKLKEGEENVQFNKLFKKIVQYLVVKEDKSSFRLKVDNILSDRENIVIEAEYYNASFELDNSKAVKISLFKDGIEMNSYELLQVGNSYRLDIGNLNSGEYLIKASRLVNGRIQEKTIPVVVESRSLESLSLQANHHVLRELSKSTQGLFYNKESLKSFLNDLSSKEKYQTLKYTESLKELLIKNKWILFLIVALLAIEWMFRKWEGVV